MSKKPPFVKYILHQVNADFHSMNKETEFNPVSQFPTTLVKVEHALVLVTITI